MKKNKTVTDLAVVNCLHQISLIKIENAELFPQKVFSMSQPVARFWGQDVNVFSYCFTLTAKKAVTAEKIQAELNRLLKIYEQQQQLTAEYYQQSLIVSDCWLENNQLNIDVAYVINQATANYLIDVRRAEKDH
ncbi:hypothetical protein [Liquorilactobacillus sicerae]|uniref:hypothetical protein n=1 Tax=Liquorilactobacillus sicerae TaxID=1416943 RepID=UPI002480C30D|nr:hypothetical protein [Liquorilactobacillus sicerae]